MSIRVFKFGGASVKEASAVKNVAKIIQLFPNDQLAVVISAMGKTTNHLEVIVDALWKKEESIFLAEIEKISNYHTSILKELIQDESQSIYAELNQVLTQLKERYQLALRENYDFEYDQIVSLGEVISTKIVAAYLKELGIASAWMDARRLIKTNNLYREGKVDWEKTTENIQHSFGQVFPDQKVVITQGFIGYTSEGFTTTLGREGSDYTAGILAYSLNAKDVTIWKDVPGMLNADPKWFDDTVKLDAISFKEAIELAYYGASVIHPKTIKPLQNKGIPLYVKSFVQPEAEGTVIQESTQFDHLIPSFIFKMNQVLFSFTPKDFSFIVEENLSDIFNRLAKINAKINLMQNSALSFSILLDADKINIQKMIALFDEQYNVKYNEGLELVTIRHYDQATIDRVTVQKEIILEQKTRQTIRMVMKDLV
jgi:aspartate kinase